LKGANDTNDVLDVHFLKEGFPPSAILLLGWLCSRLKAISLSTENNTTRFLVMVKIFFYFSEGLTFYCFCIKVLPFEKSLDMKGKTFRILLYSSTMLYYNKGKTFRILLTKKRGRSLSTPPSWMAFQLPVHDWDLRLHLEVFW
jgi:hypothetical protein